MQQLQASRVCQLKIKCDLVKKIYNLQRIRNKKQSNGVMFEMMMSKMIVNLNMLSSVMKNRVVSNLNKTLVVTIHRSRMKE
jgi:hypothetical protein